MRGFIILLALVLASAWGAFEVRKKDKSVSNGLYVVSGILLIILIAAFATTDFGD